MIESDIKRKRRTRAQVGSGLIPVTMRMSMQDRDHMERAARLRGSSLSEWLRDVVEDHRTSASLQQRLDQVEVHLRLMLEHYSSDRNAASISTKQIEQRIASLNEYVAATASAVEQFTTLIQNSFEQLFQAFFKLQSYIEQMLKVQGGRR